MGFSKPELEGSSVPFESVLDEETEVIFGSRRKRGVVHPGLTKEDLKEDLIGLSFSGGGIRSATFNLGVIQAFAKDRLLRHVDYLSTVSGGGYIGSWLSSWAYHRSRSKTPGANHIAQVEAKLNREPKNVMAKPDPDQVRFLRQYSNYLTPRLGTLSGDTLAFAGTYIRNLLLNQIILFTFAFALLGIPWICGLLLKLLKPGPGIRTIPALATMVPSLLLLLWILWRITKNSNGNHADPPRTVIWQIAVPEFLFCALLIISVWHYVNPHHVNPESSVTKWGYDWCVQMESFLITKFSDVCPAFITKLFPDVYPALLVVAVTAVVYTIFWFFVALISAWSAPRMPGDEKTRRSRILWVPVPWAFPAGLVAGAFLLLGSKVVADFTPWDVLTFGIPMGVLLVLLVGCIHLGLIGRSYYDGLREWWAKLGGTILAMVICWFALCLIALFVPLWLKLLWNLLTSQAPNWVTKLWQGMGALGITGAVGGWLTVTFRGLLIAKGPNSGAPANGAAYAPQQQKELLARLAPPVFVFGVLVLLSYLLYFSFPLFTNASVASADGIACSLDHDMYWNSLKPTSDWWKLALFALGLYLVSRFLGWRVDVNEFSLHNAYRNRLVRCYLGATNPDRNGQAFTGFDEADNFPLHLLKGLGAPFHILNATLNAVKGKDLALQTRKAYSFVFTPLYSGFEYVKEAVGTQPKKVHGVYRLTEDCSKNARPYPGARLGTAMAISGAAASPNMGFYTTPAVSFLLTVFNVRLGWWLGNPMKQEWWESGNPRSSWRALFNELAGTTTEEAREVYLSDGGHFDNLGVYELVRRRCRLIIACDAGADPSCSCVDLARLVEKCRVDLGAEISIDLGELRPAAPLFPGDATMRVSKSAFSKGTIRYEDGHTGKLIFIKPCLNTKLPQDVLAYARTAITFPHQSTVDQFFDETQFESYRALGYACASAAAAAVESAMRR
ncbi:MAG: patatin-like phospholipase family protein [Syntrophobacteraceae bacterium]